MAYYIQKSILKTRDQFSKPDNFVNLNALIEEVADAGNPDLSAVQDDIDDLQTDLGTVQTDLGTTDSVAKTFVVNLSLTKKSDIVVIGDSDCFVVPAYLNNYVLVAINARHHTASSGSTSVTALSVLRSGQNLVNGQLQILANATNNQAITTDQTKILSTGELVEVNVTGVVSGGTPPDGLFVTMVFQPAP